ncbi:MAG: hypothetical protein SAK29_08280 [Scytonema sp. PMC 1069.18]|nr:hypothetical protein [Scytonema sp. PMC 1069.18]MEC4880866.1 hypothetical protein [Scytonema sp. PMC 1070.18]
MKGSENCNSQMEINDLIDNAIINAVARRELSSLSEQEATKIFGGLTSEIAVAGFKEVEPICPPTKPTVKPICPPIVVGLIALPDSEKLA